MTTQLRCGVKISDRFVQLLSPKTMGSLIRISPNFHNMYRNDCRLTWWNQNFDIPIRFRMPTCQMNDDFQIAAESQQIFNFCSLKRWSYFTDLHQNFTRCNGISVVNNPCIYKTMLHFVWKCQNNEWGRSILTSAKRPSVSINRRATRWALRRISGEFVSCWASRRRGARYSGWHDATSRRVNPPRATQTASTRLRFYRYTITARHVWPCGRELGRPRTQGGPNLNKINHWRDHCSAQPPAE